MLATLSSLLFVSLHILLLSPKSYAIEPGQLGVKINDGVALGDTKRVILGSIATISGLSGWTDEQIVDMAFIAHGDMLVAHQALGLDEIYAGLPKKPPSATTTLVVDNTAYISSSMMGGPYLYQPNGNTEGSRFTTLDPAHPCEGAVQDALIRCQTSSVDFTGHRTGACCGEPMAALAFCTTNNQQDLTNAKIVTIIGKNKQKIVPPCGNPKGQLYYTGEWGCHDLTTERGLNMHVIPETTGRTSTEVSPDDIAVVYATYP